MKIEQRTKATFRNVPQNVFPISYTYFLTEKVPIIHLPVTSRVSYYIILGHPYRSCQNQKAQWKRMKTSLLNANVSYFMGV